MPFKCLYWASVNVVRLELTAEAGHTSVKGAQPLLRPPGTWSNPMPGLAVVLGALVHRLRGGILAGNSSFQ